MSNDYSSITVNFTHAEDLLRALSPLARGEFQFNDDVNGNGNYRFVETTTGDSIWFPKYDTRSAKAGDGARDWLFRGVSNATFDGVPSGWRQKPQSLLLTWLNQTELAKTEPRERAFAEMCLLSDYFKKCDSQGLPIPGDSAELRSGKPPKTADEMPEEWPSESVLPLLATIQHNLTNTRLLDLSRRPLISTWFAASGPIDKGEHKDTGSIVVWCIRNAKIPKDCNTKLLELAGLKVYAPPRADNPNLHLQSGKMVYLPLATEFKEGNDAVLDYHQRIFEAAHKAAECSKTQAIDWVRRFVLPWSETPALLSLLNAHFVHGARVYAGHRGVSEAVKLDILSGRKHS